MAARPVVLADHGGLLARILSCGCADGGAGAAAFLRAFRGVSRHFRAVADASEELKLLWRALAPPSLHSLEGDLASRSGGLASRPGGLWAALGEAARSARAPARAPVCPPPRDFLAAVDLTWRRGPSDERPVYSALVPFSWLMRRPLQAHGVAAYKLPLFAQREDVLSPANSAGRDFMDHHSAALEVCRANQGDFQQDAEDFPGVAQLLLRVCLLHPDGRQLPICANAPLSSFDFEGDNFRVYLMLDGVEGPYLRLEYPAPGGRGRMHAISMECMFESSNSREGSPPLNYGSINFVGHRPSRNLSHIDAGEEVALEEGDVWAALAAAPWERRAR